MASPGVSILLNYLLTTFATEIIADKKSRNKLDRIILAS